MEVKKRLTIVVPSSYSFSLSLSFSLSFLLPHEQWAASFAHPLGTLAAHLVVYHTNCPGQSSPLFCLSFSNAYMHASFLFIPLFLSLSHAVTHRHSYVLSDGWWTQRWTR